MMQPADHMSEGYDQPSSRVTSGPRYWRVLMIRVLARSCSYVAPPKSITVYRRERRCMSNDGACNLCVGLGKHYTKHR